MMIGNGACESNRFFCILGMTLTATDCLSSTSNGSADLT